MAEKVTIGNCELWHGDSLEILPLVFADCAITDPPYGVNLGETGETAIGKTAYIGFVDDVDYVRKVCVPVVLICIEKFARVMLTPGNRNCFEYPKPDEIGAIYNAAGAGFCRWGTNTSQPILYYGKDPHSKKKKPQAIQWKEISEKNGHPCPKPIRLMNWFVDRASLVGETVCDPFMGSGTTGVACVNLGRKFVGIEKERQYFDIACRRIEQAYAQPRLFEDEKVGAGDTAVQCEMLLPANARLSGPQQREEDHE